MPPTWCPCAATLQAPAALGPARELVSGEDAQKSALPRLPAEWTNIRYPAGFAPNQARTRVTVVHFTRDANPAGGAYTVTERPVAT